MAEIDELSIGIEAEAPKAAKTIDSLVGKLDILVKRLSAIATTPVKINIDTSGFDKIGKSLKLDGLDKTAKFIGASTAQITNKIEEFRKKYEDIGKSFEASDSLKKAQSQLLQFSDLFQKAKLNKESFEASGDVNTKGYERTVENFYKYGNVIENIKQKITELNHTPIKFDFSQISQMSEAELDKALGFPNVSTWADKISQSAKEVAEESRESAREFTGAWNGIELPNFDSDIKNLGDKLRQLEIPPIKEENLDKLSASLEKAERSLDELRANLANGITMGRITESVDDKGYVKLQEQIALTEKTAAALRDRIKEVGKESKNASGIKEVGKAANSASNSFSDLAKSGTKASNSLKKVQSGLKSVLRALLPILGIRELINLSQKSVESIGDYMESFNFYDVAFNKVASEWSGDFEKYGYQNASSYAESFTDRMDSTFKKLSGVSFEINADGKGLLSETGLKNLGLNIQEITQYASQLASVTNSLGLVGEASLATSSAFTKLAGDISSLFNVDYKTAADNLQSGLIGQSRALYKYGIDITNATLQTKAYEIGLTKAVSEMTQAEKMQLRVLSILEQSKVAWGDQARTLNQFANQMRFLKNGVQELSTMFGQLFIPTLTKILPVVNGVIIAIKRMVGYIASLAGIELDLSGSGMSGMEEDLGDISDGFESVAASTKKAKAGLRAFDELKVINMPDTSGVAAGGAGAGIDLTDEILKATEEYEKAWSEAFKNMENKAQEWADKIEKALEPIKKIFQDFAIGDFFQAGKDVSALVVSITDFFADAIDKVDWYGIGKKIGDFLAGVDWLSILKSVGNLIWQALKAAFELYVGAFSAAPLETALISLVAFPKLLKAITASKFITGIGKLWKNFKVWGEKISLVTGALAGNKAAASGLYMLYPKLGAKVDAVKTAFSKFFSSVKTNGFWKTVDGGITNIRNNLGGLQKAAIVAVAGFAEFSVVSDSVEKLTLGTENWLAEIGKISGVVAVAAAAMYTALGPAGLVIAGITGVVAAIKGINDAFDTIRAQEIGESIKNAMSNPGGVPLSEVTAQFSDAIGKIGESFNVVTEKAAGLEQADSHIRDTWMEIEKIETAMETGVMSVDEGKQELERLFGELATTASDKFGQLEDTLLAAFGENGVLTGVYERLGISTENTITRTIELHDKAKKRIEELSSALATMDPSNPNYVTYKEELSALLSQTDELTDAVSKYEFALKQIDYSDLISEDGTLNTTALQNFLEELKTATETANTDIENAINTTRQSLEQEKSLAESLGDWVAAEEIQEKLDALPDAMELLKGDISLKAVALTDTVQNDFIGGMNKVIEDAQTEWGEKGFWGQIWNGVFGAGTEGEFVKEAVDQQVKNIEQLSTAIETQLGDLKTDSPGWAKDAIGALYESLFDTEYRFSDMGGGKTVYSLNEDFRSLINGATEGISELAKERGKDATDGYANGFSNETNIQNAQNEAKSFTEKVLDTIAKTQDSNSPSKVTMALGKDATDGYAKGFRDKENILNAQNAVSEFTSSVLDKFSEVIAPLNQIGIDAMQGLLNGLSSMESNIYAKADEIANNVANSVKTALDIHSPSRVMFALGDYTMQGFQKGMENLYQPILSSVKSFSYDVSVAPAPILTDMYGGYQYQPTYTPQYGFAEYPQSSYNQSNTETNALLRQILSAIREGKTITIGQDEIGRASVRYIQGEERRLQKSLVGIY